MLKLAPPHNQAETPTAHEVYLCYEAATARVERAALLEQLLAQHATPLIQTILRRKLQPYRADDTREIEQQIHVKVLTRLQSAEPLQDFSAFVAVVTYHTCADWQRQRQPQRHALKNRLRYLLTHTEGLALWEQQSHVWWCGRADWGQCQAAASQAKLDALRASLPLARPLRELVTALFAQLNQPVELDDLVNWLAAAQGIHDEAASADALETFSTPTPCAATTIERRAYLQTLWNEIKQLPLLQRHALLLNLRDHDGSSLLALFQFTGVARLQDLAEVLELTVQDFVALWQQLPLDDLNLAARLNLTRQQIINLRLSARRRLARRMGKACQ